MASVVNVEVELLKSSLAVVESECRKNGFYLASCIEANGQTYMESVYSLDGKLYFANTACPVPPERVVEVFIDSLVMRENIRYNEVHITNNLENCESSK